MNEKPGKVRGESPGASITEGQLDHLLREARPEPHWGLDADARLMETIIAAEREARRRRSRPRLVASTAAAAVVLGVAGTAAANGGLRVPAWVTNFGYDAHHSYVDQTGERCYEALLVSPYVRDDDPNPPSPETQEKVLQTARQVVNEFDLASMGRRATQDDVKAIAEAIDTRLHQRGLPEAYSFGFMGDCGPDESQ